MLQVFRSASSAFEPRAKDVDSNGFPLVLEADVDGPLELLEDDGSQQEHVAAVVGVAGEDDGYADYDDDGDDSDYRPEDEGSEADDEDADDEKYLQSLEKELDDAADEVSDVYLKRMMEARDQLQGEDAAWVDKYVQAQRAWKEKHGSSIDEMDLDLHLAEKKRSSSDGESSALQSKQFTALVEAWNGRISPHLPPSLQNQPGEFILSLIAGVLFVVIALVVQFYVILRSPQYV